jgi:hypothetical protein
MDAPNIGVAVLYGLVFMLQLYTTKTISAHEDEVERLRLLNVKTWTL